MLYSQDVVENLIGEYRKGIRLAEELLKKDPENRVELESLLKSLYESLEKHEKRLESFK